MISDLKYSKWEPNKEPTKLSALPFAMSTEGLQRKSYGTDPSNKSEEQSHMARMRGFMNQLDQKKNQRATERNDARMNNQVPVGHVENFETTPQQPSALMRVPEPKVPHGNYSTVYNTPKETWGAGGDFPNVGFDQFKLFEQLGHIRYMLEKQQEERTGHVGEEFAMFVFVAVLTIYIIDSFNK